MNYIDKENIVSASGSISIIKMAVSKFEKGSVNSKLFFKIYAAPYASVLNREITLAGISSDDIVLNIGCGAMPFTAIYYALKSGAKIIAVDNDHEVIEQAKNCVANYGLHRQIEIVEADGCNIVCIRFTKAIVALQAAPKDEVLKNLLKVSPPNTDLLFRQPRNIFRNHYGTVDESEASSFVRHFMPTFGKTLLFTKQ